MINLIKIITQLSPNQIKLMGGWIFHLDYPLLYQFIVSNWLSSLSSLTSSEIKIIQEWLVHIVHSIPTAFIDRRLEAALQVFKILEAILQLLLIFFR